MRENNLSDNSISPILVLIAACKGTSSNSFATFYGELNYGELRKFKLLDECSCSPKTQENKYHNRAKSVPLRLTLTAVRGSYIIIKLGGLLR